MTIETDRATDLIRHSPRRDRWVRRFRWLSPTAITLRGAT
jgi:hypothetical protein